MADLQTDGARVLSLWRNEGISSYRKRPRDPARLARELPQKRRPTEVSALIIGSADAIGWQILI
jgi:hypothetical protein